MLRVTNYTKYYGKKIAVDNLSIHIQKGEIYGFIGHNGAGKTTTLKACCGLLTPDRGDIFIDGISILRYPLECKKKIAYIPDNPDLYEFMTGIKYLNFIADVYAVPPDKRAVLTEKYSNMLGLTDNLAQQISSYSHGMKQKLAVISALIHSPSLLIMDEPFVGLDPLASHQLKLVMRELCDNGAAIFFSTHVLETAEKICDKIAIIKNGKCIVNGTMSEIKGDESLEDVFLELAD